MKKFITIISTTIAFSFFVFAQEQESMSITPNVVARFSSPAKFFGELSTIMREVYPNPKLELQASFALMPFGYPHFTGVSKKENSIVCVYGIDSQEPVIIAAFKTDGEKEPVFAKTLSGGNRKIIKDGGYIFVIHNAKDKWEKYLDDTRKKTKEKKTQKLAKIYLDSNALKYILPNADKNILSDINCATLSIYKDNSRAKISAEIELKKTSALCKKIGEIESQPNYHESEFIPQDRQITIISKVALPIDIFKFIDCAQNQLSDITAQKNGTFALSANLGKPLEISSVGATKMENNDILELAKKISDKNSISNETVKIGDVYCVKTSTTKFPKENIYSTIHKGYAVSTSNEIDMKNILNKISNAQRNENYPLKKYTSTDCDVIAVANTKAILKYFLAPTGAKIKDDANLTDNFATLKFISNKIKIFLSIDMDSLRYFADYYRMTRKK